MLGFRLSSFRDQGVMKGFEARMLNYRFLDICQYHFPFIPPSSGKANDWGKDLCGESNDSVRCARLDRTFSKTIVVAPSCRIEQTGESTTLVLIVYRNELSCDFLAI